MALVDLAMPSTRKRLRLSLFSDRAAGAPNYRRDASHVTRITVLGRQQIEYRAMT